MSRQVPLATFVPRGAIEWLADEPDRRHQVVDGSLVFVDLSGFTALSERLARLGKVGSEEVTAVLNTVFNGLLAVAYGDGGSLLKFGGDALLLLYTGASHALHACRAAVRMRDHLRGLSPLGSSAGNIQLRMTLGVHSAPVDHFLVGREHRDLVLAGPAVSAVVRAEGAAHAGEVLVTDATAALLPARTTEERTDGLHRLRTAPDAGDFLPPVIKEIPAGIDVGSLLARAVHDRLVEGVDEGEHRPAVIAFIGFRGSDGLLAEEGPDALAAALDELVTAVQAASDRYGASYLASDIDADGGKIVLLAGVPTAAEFDGEQMLRTVVDVTKSGCRLPVRVGVHRGRVFAGVIGPHFRLTYTVIGDAVNLAARVMARAGSGQVLATTEALNRSQVIFEAEELPPFEVKGKAKPVQAWVVGNVTAQRLRPHDRHLPLVGRGAELGELIARLDAATAGTGGLVVLTGEAGLGKSRLIGELQERRQDVPFIVAGAQRYEQHTAYYVVGRLLRTLLGALDNRPSAEQVLAVLEARAPNLVPWTPLVGDALGVEIDDTAETADLQAEFRAERLAEVVSDLIAICMPGPMVLVLEDVHWLDAESQRVLAQLAVAHLADQPWLLLATARTQLRVPDGAPEPITIELQPLTDEAVRELTLSAAEQGMIAMDRVDRVADRSSGNPLFLEELVASGDDEEDLPDSLETLVQSRIDRLDGPDRDRLRIAAVLGDEFDLELLTAAAGAEVARDDGAWERLDAFLEPVVDGTFRFRHALVHDAAYAALPFRKRRDLHERAAAALQRRHRGNEEEVAELLALHFYNARAWDQAWRYNCMAGDRARERHANSSAANNYRRAVEVARHARVEDEELAGVYETLANVLELSGSLKEATDAMAGARRWARDEDLPRLHRLEGLLRERLGRYTQAVRWYRRALRTVEERSDPVEATMLHAGLAIIRLNQGRTREGLALGEDAVRHAEASGSRQALARAHFVLAWAWDELGDHRGAEHRATAIDLYEELGDLRGLAYLHNLAGVDEADAGLWDDAVTHYERAAEFAVRLGDRASQAIQLVNVGEIRSNQGRYDEAEVRLSEGLGIARAAGHSMATAYGTMVSGRMDSRAGRYDRAEERLASARRAFVELGSPRLATETRVFQAELTLFRGDALAAEAAAAGIVGEDDEDAFPVAVRVLSCAVLLRGDHAAALACARRSLQLAERAGTPFEVALARVVLAHAEGADLPSDVGQDLGRLGVVAPPELLVFGPTSDRARTTRPQSLR